MKAICLLALSLSLGNFPQGWGGTEKENGTVNSGATVSSDSSSAVPAIFAGIKPADPGCVVSVMRQGEVTYRRAFGLASIELGAPLSVDSVFNLESLSKQFTAMSVAILVADGRVSLENEIHQYVPSLPRYSHSITVGQLLHHTSGLKDYEQLLAVSGVHSLDLTTRDMALRLLARAPTLNFTPGTEFSYNNTNYLVLAIIVENVSGMSLADFARKRVFEPLQMNDTRFRTSATAVIPKLATGYRHRSDGWHLGPDNDEVNGAGGVFSTVGDLAKWNASLLDHSLGGEAASQVMSATVPLLDGTPGIYAGGTFVRSYMGLKVFEHTGDGPGFQTAYVRFPDQRLGVAVFCNSRDAQSPLALAHKVSGLYLAGAVQGRTTPAAPIAYDYKRYQRYTGVYWDGRSDLLRDVGVRDGKLTQRLLPDDEPSDLNLVGDGTFSTRSGILYKFTDGNASFERRSDEGTSVYTRIPAADMRPRPLDGLLGRYYSNEADAHWTLLTINRRLVLRRTGFPDETLDFQFGDAFLSDNGLLHFSRSKSGKAARFELLNYRVGKVTFDRESGDAGSARLGRER